MDSQSRKLRYEECRRMLSPRRSRRVIVPASTLRTALDAPCPREVHQVQQPAPHGRLPQKSPTKGTLRATQGSAGLLLPRGRVTPWHDALMAHLLRVDLATATPAEETTMSEERLEETKHLEQWIVQHPEVIDDGLKVVATQYNRWASVEGGSAKEALDVLALSSSGQTVVIELKRGSDRRVHLQAITYGALVAGFDQQILAAAHARWLAAAGTQVTNEEALEHLTEHLESGWDEEILKLPKLVLVAEAFPDQVLTTVQWLTDTVASGLEIECHEYSLFRDGDGLYASFRKIFPVENLEGRTLRPIAAVDAGEVRERIATRERRARSVKVIAERRGIPDFASIDLDLETLVKSEIVDQIRDWLDAVPNRRSVTWVNDLIRPLRWAEADDPDAKWTPTALRDEIFAKAGVGAHNFSAADGWRYQGQSLYWVAQNLLNGEDAEADSELMRG